MWLYIPTVKHAIWLVITGAEPDHRIKNKQKSHPTRNLWIFYRYACCIAHIHYAGSMQYSAVNCTKIGRYVALLSDPSGLILFCVQQSCTKNLKGQCQAFLSLFSTWRICLREHTKKWERFLLVRGEFFRQPILTNHVAGFLFSFRVARTKWPSEK